MQGLLTWHNPLTRWTATALAVLLLAGAPAAPAAAAAIELIGTGTVPGTATDSLGATPATLEDGTPHNRVGGFGSAVAYTGSGNLYIGTPDRGPADGTTSYQDRYYLLDISVAPGTPTPVTVSVIGGALLTNEAGGHFTGSLAAFDAGNSPASLRLDPEGVRLSKTGTFFVSDEYGPFLYEFDAGGRRLRSLAIPAKFLIDHPNAVGANELPPGNTKGRQANRGMEGLAITPDGTKLFGIMQSALIQDGALNAQNNRRGINNRILEITLATGATRELVYQLADRSFGVNEILAINDHEFLVIERDGNAGTAAAFKQIVKIDVTGATDVSGILLPQTGLPAGVTPVTKTAFIDLLSPTFGLGGATFPEKIEGLAFGPDLPDGRHLLLVTSDNDFFPDNPSRVYAFAIEGSALAGFQPQTIERRLAVLGAARLWLGLKNSDDQGARFDVRVQVEKDGVPVATGEVHCVTGIVRNPDKALEVIVPFPSDPAIAVGAGDVITVSVRAGTTPTGAFCGGHASATGVRLYYDSAIRPARVGELYLHRASGGTFDSIAPPAGPPALKDSPATTLSGGNPWRLAGTWALTP